MTRRLSLAARAVSVAVVLALLGLLVWKVATNEKSEVDRSALASGKTVRAPRFDLPRLDGNGRLSLASLRGKAVVVNFWASWCAPCKEEAPILQAAWERHRGRGLVVVGVDYNDFDGEAKRFAREVGWTFPLVRDRSGDVLTRYGGTGIPETYVIDRRGNLVGQPFVGTISADRAGFERRVERALRT